MRRGATRLVNGSAICSGASQTVEGVAVQPNPQTHRFDGGVVCRASRHYGIPARSERSLATGILFNIGLQAFQEYNPVRAETYPRSGVPRTSGKARLYRYRTFGDDAALFLLDERSF